MLIRSTFYYFLIVSIIIMTSCSKQKLTPEMVIENKVDSLLKLMTVEEKVGQMNQYTADGSATGQVVTNPKKLEDIKRGRVGSLLNCQGWESALKYQHLAVDSSRLHIPLIFGLDVIHGYRTVFPVPLAGSCSWDLAIIEKAERVAAIESSADGIDWTFAPMVDISRDPRWGRVMEGAGEDPYLGAKIAAARVRGFQGEGVGSENSIVACVKHFAAYGAPDAGREYNTVDMSEMKFRNYYMLPYKAAVEAGAGTAMSSFNDIFDMPASCNKFLLSDLLKTEWDFKGFVVSDWGSVGHVVNFGVAADRKEAAELCAEAGLDMEMESRCYRDNLVDLVNEGKVPVAVIDEAVRRILRMKFQIGLFDNPYRNMDQEKSKRVILCDEHIQAAREAACKAMVLLKNEKQLLPLSKDIKSIALIGPLADNQLDMLGGWAGFGNPNDCVTILQGLKNKTEGKVVINYAKGCTIDGDSEAEFAAAIAAAKKSEVVLLAMGESAVMTGEKQARGHLTIPGVQPELIKEIVKLGKPVVLLLSNGRPLCIDWENKNIPAILECWFLGIQAGNAIADVLFGDYNPSGKLTMSFPITEGQVPVCYNEKKLGIPYTPQGNWCSSYRDIPNEPLYPFGYGLSYTTFSYSPISLQDTLMTMNDTLSVSVKVKNTGRYAGEEIVQLYVADKVASIVRPGKELKGFDKIMLNPGEEKEVKFSITKDELSFWNKELKYGAEPGEFSVMIGTSSDKVSTAKFWLEE